MSWFQLETRAYFGKFIKSDGTVTSNAIPLVAGYGGYDANHLAYNPTAGSFFAVTHGNGVEDIGYEVSGTGVPSAEFQVTITGGKGNFYPRVAAHGARSEWLMTASSGFTFVAGQRVTTDTQGGNGGGGGETRKVSVNEMRPGCSCSGCGALVPLAERTVWRRITIVPVNNRAHDSDRYPA